MNSLTRQEQRSGERGDSHVTAGEPAQCGLQENVLVVLGVLYPGSDTGKDVPEASPLRPRKVPNGQHSMSVIFYDPFSSDGIDDWSPRGSIRQMAAVPLPSIHQSYPKHSTPAGRGKELEAVARELALLSLRKRL
jgi:hypothetical protein